MSYTRDQIIEAELRRLVKDVEAYLEWHQKEGPFPILECDLKYSHLALDSSPRNATPIPPASPDKAQVEQPRTAGEVDNPNNYGCLDHGECAKAFVTFPCFSQKLNGFCKDWTPKPIPPASADKAQDKWCSNCGTDRIGPKCAFAQQDRILDKSTCPNWQPKPAVAQEKPREWTAEDRLCWLEDHPECFAPSSAIRLYAMRHALNEYIDGHRPSAPADSGKKGNL